MFIDPRIIFWPWKKPEEIKVEPVKKLNLSQWDKNRPKNGWSIDPNKGKYVDITV